MKMNKFLLGAACSALMILCGCSSSKKATSQSSTLPSAPAAQYVAAVAQTQADWQYLQCSGKITLATNSSFSSAMQMRMKRGEYIFVSLRPILGIEAAKMLIANGKVLLIDKLHKKYVEESMEILTSGLDLDISTMQDIFLGRAFVLGKGSVTANMKDEFAVSTDGALRLTPLKQNRMFSYSFGYDNNMNITDLTVNIGALEKAYQALYSEVLQTVAGKVATQAQINADFEGAKIALALSYRNLQWNEPLEMSCDIPADYTKIELEALLNSIK